MADKEICPTCKGKKTVKATIITKGGVEPGVTIWCLTCSGSGKVDKGTS